MTVDEIVVKVKEETEMYMRKVWEAVSLGEHHLDMLAEKVTEGLDIEQLKEDYEAGKIEVTEEDVEKGIAKFFTDEDYSDIVTIVELINGLGEEIVVAYSHTEPVESAKEMILESSGVEAIVEATSDDDHGLEWVIVPILAEAINRTN